jgi:predicted ATP-grasp superfamily ATP-dependent carboligase
MGKFFLNKRIGVIFKTCPKNRNQWFSQKNENHPTLDIIAGNNDQLIKNLKQIFQKKS